MKKILNTLIILLAAAFLGSCNSGKADGGIIRQENVGLMTVEVLTDGAEADDHILTARFIIFDDASVYPKVSYNEVVSLEPDDRDAKVFRVTLGVTCNPDKMLAVVLNEPPGASSPLEEVDSPARLEDIMFEMNDAFHWLFTAPGPTGLPMSGVRRGISVTEANDKEESAAPVTIHIERSVARIELWLKLGDNLESAEVNSSSQVTMKNSHTHGYLAAGTIYDGTRFQPEPDDNFGHMLTVARPITGSIWQYEEDEPLEITDAAKMVVAFYVPERTCEGVGDDDKLQFFLFNIATSTGLRNAEIVLDEFIPEGGNTPEPLRVIQRNNIYRITGRLEGETIVYVHEVLPWTQENQGVIIDPQYYLRVSGDNLSITNNGESAAITAVTNYDRPDGDRGFPAGIVIGTVGYFDNTSAPVNDSDGDLYGWLNVSLSGDDPLVQTVTFTAAKDLAAGSEGYYALVEIKAGNVAKIVKVVRS